MALYKIQLSKKAEKQLDKLSDRVAEPILNEINKLAFNPRPFGYIKLTGRNAYRIWIGNYRVIYEIFDKQLLLDVIEVGDRKEIY